MNLSIIGGVSTYSRNNEKFKWATPLIRDIPGGSYSMNLLADEPSFTGDWSQAVTNAFHNARDPGDTLGYEINPNFWCMDYIDQLSGIVIAKDDAGTSFVNTPGAAWRTRYGWFPITKRHVVGTGHSFTHAAGTWGPNPNQTVPTRIRWRDKNGITVDRVQLHQATSYVGSNEANDFGTNRKEITVAVLDEDLPDSIFIPKIVPNKLGYRYYAVQLNQYQAGIHPEYLQRFAISQEWTLESDPEQHDPRYWGNDFVPELYPSNHRSMAYIENDSAGTLQNYQHMSFRVWGGDSGTPILTVIDGEVHFYGIVSGFSPFYTPPGYSGRTWEWIANKLIEIADDNAIALGRMAQRTGYTITVAT